MDLWNTIKQYVSDTQGSDTLVREVPQFAEARREVESYLDAARRRSLWNIKPKDLEAGESILKAGPSFQIAALLAALSISKAARHGADYQTIFRLKNLIGVLLRKSLPYSDKDVERLVRLGLEAEESSKAPLLRILEDRVKAGVPLSDPVRAALETWRADLEPGESGVNAVRLQIQIGDLLAGTNRAPLLEGEPWGDGVRADLASMPPHENAHWSALLLHAMTSEAAKPSTKWLKQAKPLLGAIGQEAFIARLTTWSTLFRANHYPENALEDGYERYMEWMRLSALVGHNYSALKGMVWCCRLIDHDAMAPLLGDLADHALRKIPGHGPKSAKVGNACILTLGAMSGMAPVAQLSRLKRKVKYVASQGMIETALAEAAQRAGLPAEDLEELATPTFGLDTDGRRREELGEYFADLLLKPSGHTDLIWSDKNGKALKSVPADVKKNHAETLKELKQTFAEMTKMLPTLRDRLEGLLLTERAWTIADWRDRYLDHPVMGALARRLIWSFTDEERTVLGIWRDGAMVDETGHALPSLSESTKVQLWHPLSANPETVLAWRRWLEAKELQQPFKQAHREIYILTDAEVATATYSNRFAAHIIRQHQFQALCRERGWRYQLQGGFDGHNTPTLNLPQHGLRAEFWVEGGDGHAMSASYIDLYVSTDQVRFYNDRGALLPLADVPPLLFSEIMRDVDLFVGVCSLGNDPNWQNNGELRAYWNDYSFGDLTAPAQTRRDVLSRLIPRLKIAAQCTLDGKFLHIRGSLRTYKIHLGSGNILMEPNDQYLCIVPDRKKDAKADASHVFLPFEGDQTLAVILSKAFLLAEDGKIKDATILRQIRS
ncbi:MAG: DUF4132 domain-containing protein [Capsulimonas sp.]|uniref:DUF4132 domain-containing protein n=1 Tax=Capsulimonas sp. TaxID=2494211 RepID=UPI00326550EB